MSFLDAIILSVVEGITEFLPISSTGHLILTANFLEIPQTEFVKTFEIAIQLGAILAVIFLYFKILITDLKIWKNILISFIPTAILGLVFYDFIKEVLFESTEVIIASLFLGGVALIAFEYFFKNKKNNIESVREVSLKNAVMIGLFQSMSMIPGVSRAAATIFGGLFSGLSRKAAVEYSFLLAIPTMFAATGLDLIKTDLNFSTNEIQILILGIIGSFITATLSIKFLLNFIEKNNFISFGIYRIIMAVLFWLLFI